MWHIKPESYKFSPDAANEIKGKKIRSISGQLPQTPAGRRRQKSLETLAFPFPPPRIFSSRFWLLFFW